MYWSAQTYRQRGARLTVNDLVSAAGVGRNTFYEYFDGLEHALAYASQAYVKLIGERIVIELEGARTPIARLRTLSRVWFEVVVEEPAAMTLLARRREAAAMSASAELFREMLQVALDTARHGLAIRSDPAREACCALAAEGASLYVLDGAAHGDEVQSALDLILTRVFR